MTAASAAESGLGMVVPLVRSTSTTTAAAATDEWPAARTRSRSPDCRRSGSRCGRCIDLRRVPRRLSEGSAGGGEPSPRRECRACSTRARAQNRIAGEGSQKRVDEVVLRLPEQPWVVSGPRLIRGIDNVPLSELAAEVIRAGGDRMARDAGGFPDILRAIARKYGVIRFRDQANARMWAAAELARDEDRSERLRLR